MSTISGVFAIVRFNYNIKRGYILQNLSLMPMRIRFRASDFGQFAKKKLSFARIETVASCAKSDAEMVLESCVCLLV